MTQIPAGGIPDLIPVLSRGRHLDPADGGCVMEMASLLAGERWSDAPRCTHPLLAAVARLVNDELADEQRQRLLPLAADLVGATGGGGETAPELVRVCARTGLMVDPRSRRLRAALARAQERLAKPRDGRWRDVLYTYGAATHAVVRAIDTIVRRDPKCDDTLVALLGECIAAVRATSPLPADATARPVRRAVDQSSSATELKSAHH